MLFLISPKLLRGVLRNPPPSPPLVVACPSSHYSLAQKYHVSCFHVVNPGCVVIEYMSMESDSLVGI